LSLDLLEWSAVEGESPVLQLENRGFDLSLLGPRVGLLGNAVLSGW